MQEQLSEMPLDILTKVPTRRHCKDSTGNHTSDLFAFTTYNWALGKFIERKNTPVGHHLRNAIATSDSEPTKYEKKETREVAQGAPVTHLGLGHVRISKSEPVLTFLSEKVIFKCV